MKQEIVVFLGPSLPRTEAARILDARYLPPAKRGDIPAAVREGAKIVCLIDGVFFQDCSVGHREILDAIKRGVRVIGASSMGALRASELDTLGMAGVGEIYRWYRDGEITSDDEVALIFDPESGYAMSIPLVNIRYILDLAEHMGIIDRGLHETLLKEARSLYFPHRTWDEIRMRAYRTRDHGRVDEFIAFAATAPDLKRNDAIAALLYTRDVAVDLGLI
ncbi:MAG TPA: TfuA-related McrA-glycine thioamidation protein [Methanoregulaceae archaeon]|nr:TfuA-related McrA-glycine thioamidation protein [Methanoregulaceae archaeon]